MTDTAGIIVDLSAAVKKYVAPARPVARPAARPSAPARSVARPSAPARNVARPNAPARNVARPSTPARNVARPSTPACNVAHPSTPSRTTTQPSKPTRNVAHPATPSHTATQPGKPIAATPRNVPGQVRGTHATPQTGAIGRGPGAIGRGPGANRGAIGTGAISRATPNRSRIVSGPRGNRGQVAGIQGGQGGIARNAGPRRISINRGSRRIFVNNIWRTLIPVAALGVMLIGAESYYPDGYVAVAQPTCSGITPDGCQLSWREVPAQEGGVEWQCVQYCAQANRTVSQMALASVPASEPMPSPAPTPGPSAAVQPGEPPVTGCELVIYSEPDLKGLAAPTTESQPRLGDEGWQNEIASLEVKSGTWDFYSDEDFGGEMMRLTAGVYRQLDDKWTKRIGSFMCAQPR